MSEPDCFFWSPLPPSLPDSEEQAARPHKRLTTSSDFVQRFIERNSSKDNDILRCGILTHASVFERLTCSCSAEPKKKRQKIQEKLFLDFVPSNYMQMRVTVPLQSPEPVEPPSART